MYNKHNLDPSIVGKPSSLQFITSINLPVLDLQITDAKMTYLKTLKASFHGFNLLAYMQSYFSNESFHSLILPMAQHLSSLLSYYSHLEYPLYFNNWPRAGTAFLRRSIC